MTGIGFMKGGGTLKLLNGKYYIVKAVCSISWGVLGRPLPKGL